MLDSDSAPQNIENGQNHDDGQLFPENEFSLSYYNGKMANSDTVQKNLDVMGKNGC